MIIVMDTSILEGLGFTKAESKVYFTLLEIGPCTAGPVIEKSDLQSSVVHNCLHMLKDKGLVSYVIKGKIKYYEASDPQTVLRIIDDKKKMFQDILPELELKKKLAKEKLEATVYKGNKAVMAMLTDLIKDAKKGEEYPFFAVEREGYDEEIQKFFERYDTKRKEKGIVVMGLANKDIKRLFEERVKKKLMNMRYVDQAIPKGISIFRDKVITMVWT
ncbi:MAG: hypothetical protein NT001_04265, partial [Candidatus Woesearchaeota archaeon]|nr:hypothetical protein [Candidatus Woesearchaeota archaeon]